MSNASYRVHSICCNLRDAAKYSEILLKTYVQPHCFQLQRVPGSRASQVLICIDRFGKHSLYTALMIKELKGHFSEESLYKVILTFFA